MSENNGTLSKLWKGDLPLAHTFWLYFVLIDFIFKGLTKAMFPKPGMWIIVLLHLGWAGYMITPIWRAAGKYEGPAIWAMLARLAAILIGISVLAGVSWITRHSR